MKILFNLTEDQIKRQSGKVLDKCDYNSPIRAEASLIPCVEGSNELLIDKETCDMLYTIYRGLRNDDR